MAHTKMDRFQELRSIIIENGVNTPRQVIEEFLALSMSQLTPEQRRYVVDHVAKLTGREPMRCHVASSIHSDTPIHRSEDLPEIFRNIVSKLREMKYHVTVHEDQETDEDDEHNEEWQGNIDMMCTSVQDAVIIIHYARPANAPTEPPGQRVVYLRGRIIYYK